MGSLVTYSLDDYKKLAVDLALNPVKLATLKERLSKNRDDYPLFNTVEYSRDFEKGLHAVYQRKLGGLTNQDITVNS
jgi:predicted O-linked N-acetylglucosamine transferase (SPINDLY family)